MEPFVHLHVHSDYSILDGACRIALPDELKKQDDPLPTLPKLAAKMGFPAIALTDHGALFGALEFQMACDKVNDEAKKDGKTPIKPIIGCEIYMTAGNRLDPKTWRTGGNGFHFILLAKNNAGYGNLVKMVSASHLDMKGDKPLVDWELFSKYSSGLLGTTACVRGEIGHLFLSGDEKGALKRIGEFKELFGSGDFYLELNDHGLDEEKRLNRFLLEASKKLGVPLVAANDVHYLRKQDAETHDILTCLQAKTMQADENRTRMPHEFYLKTHSEMLELFLECPQAVSATLEVAEKCEARIETGKNKFPAYPLPEGEKQEKYLHDLCRKGMEERYPELFVKTPTDEGETKRKKLLEDRLNFELGVIDKTGFSSYFLIVWDFIHYAKQHGIPVGPGRGSAAGSLIAYALKITEVDPIRFGLLFERFLNPERVSPPDIDVDFIDDRREEVIHYVRQKYGQDCVTQIGTYGTMGAKNALRDVARVLGFSYSEGDRLSKMVPTKAGTTIHMALEQVPEFKAIYEDEDNARKIIDLAKTMEGMVRSLGMHAAGVVICDRPVDTFVPLARAQNGMTITQFDMKSVGEVGLLKMDFLGLKTLKVINDAIQMIKRDHGVDINPMDIPMDDPATLQLLNRGQNAGVFQLESDGMCKLCRDFDIQGIDDLIALIALYRPGPMDLIPDYIKRKKGETQIEYAHPLIEKCSGDTYGIMVYQEQVMQAANLLAGYSLGQSDLLRRAMGKKSLDAMQKERENFVSGAAKTNGIPAEKANEIFTLLEKFASYGFNKSHSAAYGVISFQTAWLKANYPKEYMASLMTNDIGNTEKIAVFVEECRSMGLDVLPPSINSSQAVFDIENGCVRYGLAAIKNVSETAVKHLVEERKQKGLFKSILDLCSRCDSSTLGKKTLESLIKAGALDEFDGNRARLFHQVDQAIASASDSHKDAKRGQASLFDALVQEDAQSAAAPISNPQTTNIQDWPIRERLENEKELLGFYLSGHPLDAFKDKFARFALTESSAFSSLPNRTGVRVGGMITELDVRYNKDKKPFLRGRFDDFTGRTEIFVPPKDYVKLKDRLKIGEVVILHGVVESWKGDGKLNLSVSDVIQIEVAEIEYSDTVYLKIPSSADVRLLDKLYNFIDANRGQCRVRLLFEASEAGGWALELNDYFSIKPSLVFQNEAERLLSQGSVIWAGRKMPDIPKPKPVYWQNSKASDTKKNGGDQPRRRG